MKTLVWTLWITLIPPAWTAPNTQTDHGLPGKAVVLEAVEKADRALRAYQDTLLEYRDLPVVGANVSTDQETVLAGGRALLTVRKRLAVTPEKLDGTALAVAFANVDRTALNASLTAGAALAIAGPATKRNLALAKALMANVCALRDASDSLWTILESYVRTVEPCGSQR
jgi:hypothetical protein